MTIKTIKEILDADVIFGEGLLDTEVSGACGSDMMSDVLAYSEGTSVLITGLNNPQIVRTAEMLDIVCIVLVRDKKPNEQVIQLAKSKNIAILATKHLMFTSCGLLYEGGLKGGA
jgi:predicted transcriptional regulator